MRLGGIAEDGKRGKFREFHPIEAVRFISTLEYNVAHKSVLTTHEKEVNEKAIFGRKTGEISVSNSKQATELLKRVAQGCFLDV